MERGGKDTEGADEQWAMLWRGIDELVREFGDRLIFIGGVAVYLHVSHAKRVDTPAAFVEFSHDGDFLISLSDFATLRDLEEVVPNRRLEKHQIVKHGIDFDVYLERNNRLLVPYDEAMAASAVIDAPSIDRKVRVAGLEHLLVLKLDAFRDRRGSAKGEKDERDLIRIAYSIDRNGPPHRERLEPYMTPELTELLTSVKRSPEFLQLSGRNAHQASALRKMFAGVIDHLLAEKA